MLCPVDAGCCGPVETVDIDGVRVVVRRSPRARRVRLVASAGRGVELVLPPKGGERTGRALVSSHHEWIRRQSARLEHRELGLERADVVWRHGEAVPLALRQTKRARVVPGPHDPSDPLAPVVIEAPHLDDAARMVERWYREETRAAAAAILASLPAPHPTTLRIADGTSRWGSCSRSGTLSLSWRLMLAPFEVLDYVAVHEACHLRHLNHGVGFWAAVEQLRPDWRTPHAWLRQHGCELHAYDPAIAVQPLLAAA